MGAADVGAEGDDVQVGILLGQQPALQAGVDGQQLGVDTEGLLVLAPG